MGFNDENKIEILVKKYKSLEKEKETLESKLQEHNDKWMSLFKEKESEIRKLKDLNKEQSEKFDTKWKQQFGHIDDIVEKSQEIKRESDQLKKDYNSLKKENEDLKNNNDSLQKMIKQENHNESLLLEVDELEFLLGLLSKTNFVGSDVQTVFQAMYKLQERYKLISPNKKDS
tara:strand:+ start:259 stop:777 length:519 start_codon:yes stop_codon:yes gene_type:complete